MGKSLSMKIDSEKARRWAEKWDNLKPLTPPSLNIKEMFRQYFDVIVRLHEKGHGLVPVYQSLIDDGHKLSGDRKQCLSTLGRLWSMVLKEKRCDHQESKSRQKRKTNRSATSSEWIAPAGAGNSPALVEDIAGSEAEGSLMVNEGLPTRGAGDSPARVEGIADSEARDSPIAKEVRLKKVTKTEQRYLQRREDKDQNFRQLPTSEDMFVVSKR